MVRSRCKWIEEGEKNTKYFLNNEKKNATTKCINSLIVNDKIINNPKEILNAELNFYSELYAANQEVNPQIQMTHIENEFLTNTEIPKLTDTERKICEADITIEECSEALKEMPNNKSPGSDGFPAEFYKFFWNDIKEILFESFTHSFHNNELSIDQKRGILNLIPKKR